MKKLYAFFALFPLVVSAQVTINVTSIPANTPEGAAIYLAGNINNWTPDNPAYTLNNVGGGVYQIVIPEGTGMVEYKFTRGSWASVEGNATGGYLDNRSFTFTGSPQTLNLTIQSWEDLGGSVPTSTAASNVQILNDAFSIPQLNTTRRIWLYLPPDYATSDKDYPVLYMQDGQNLFDNLTAFAGEWEVDETLNELFENGDYGVIVIGIDNGGNSRLDEYSPWNNPSYGGGSGDLYAEFLAETLKPYIDANYRTRTEAEFNAVIGSSMGALIATYTALEHPAMFAKVGSMSPAYWFALSELQSYISNYEGSLADHRMYFVGGANESATMAANINSVKDNLASKGLSSNNTLVKIDINGTHTEAYWRSQFAEMYQWLFAETLATPQSGTNGPAIRQLLNGTLEVRGFDQEMNFEIYSLSGVKVASLTLGDGLHHLPEDLAKGIYILKGDSVAMKVVK